MSLNTTNLAVEIAVSNMDLYPIDLPGRASWGSDLELLVPYLINTGFNNFEVWPTRQIVDDVQSRKERGDTELVELVIGSLHQSSFSDVDLVGKIAKKRGVHKPLQSVSGMYIIQSSLDRPVVSVHYPNDPMTRLQWYRNDRQNYPGSFPVLQPAAEDYERFEITSNEILLDTAAKHELIGLCPDTAHARRKSKNGYVPPRWEDVWADQFASGQVYESHIGLDRTDMMGRDPELAAKTVREFQAFASDHSINARNTEVADMITAAIENYDPPADLVASIGKPVLRFVVEAAPSLHPWDFLRRQWQHAQISENIAEISREAGARVMFWNTTIPS